MNERALELRRAFDASFALPPPARREAAEDFLAVRAGRDPCALRVREISHFAARRKIVPLPGRRPELLGLAGIRGAIVPVYSLARAIGSAEAGPPRWLATSGGVAFAFEEFERYLRAPAPDVSGDGLVRDGAVMRRIINLASIVREITQGGSTR